ncbi:type II toxin-antitoxin system mRNA interferase toxin, RelE/StbE family [Sulfurimonas aquatica]|uniref:Type II toxin-antitoxin system mRNA interferase toxin, RelE/StbE family n=1 Tax=Sulfurimonas aquatica TaxID=2672570 RepID=A0A975GC73_9BACT|nr:type II toxin-antitoxin system RelE/ParE family toxin [Sulfurimonas aquatica]QSZ40974.1 type II toxin-antitoxin system mRNA interferase toxin, RelE/StbE family [Sulfurimonas aquatica]
MALYSIKWKLSAKKELRKLDKKEIPRIIEAVENLALNPHPSNHKKLLGSEHNFRIRVGNYRVVYFIENNELLIEIIRVRHRKDAYSIK